MGRKPNQLVTEFFTRGPKLEDASNRYQYTCKACGEHFPKGRMEILASHLANKCGALSGEDRDRALMQLRQVPEQTKSRQRQHLQENDLRISGKREKLSLAQVSSLERKLTGLEALAEASRQVEHPAQKGESAGQDENVIDPSLRETESYTRLFGSATRVHDELGTLMGGDLNEKAFFLIAIDITLSLDTDTFPALTIGEKTYSSMFSSGESLANHTAASEVADLSSIAASASNLEALLANAETTILHDNPSNSGPFDVYAELQALGPSSTWPSQRIVGRGSQMNGPATQSGRALTCSHIHDGTADQVSESHEHGHGHEQGAQRAQRIRGKFSDSRRKEVQEVRKRGLYGILADADIRRLHSTYGQLTLTTSPEQIFVTHLPDSPIYMACNATVSDLPIWDDEIDGPIPPTRARDRIVLFDDASNDAMSNLENYIKAIRPLLSAQEESPYMRAILNAASELSTEIKDPLLAQVLSLWTLTHVILSTSPHWHLLTSPPSFPPSTLPLPLPHPHFLAPRLRALAEASASTLSRRTFHALEKRLLQNPSHLASTTFLAALLLLHCAERMCWLYQTWDAPKRAAQWPLRHSPAYYVRQGDAFAELIGMLVRMRGLGKGEGGRCIGAVEMSDAYLFERAHALFNAEDPQCWELRLGGKLFLG
ncbi:hypothetical protein MMC13_008276 [Lambiella insularis]|nr:hypothetical protein [Lambiella insularis]